MISLCEVCNKEKEHCFICKGRSSTGCMEHSKILTMFKSQIICITCLSLYKCKVIIEDSNTKNKLQQKVKYNNCHRFTSYLTQIYLFFTFKKPPENKPIVIECDNIKKCCPICRKKDTINCPIHNTNIKNTCNKCVKLFLCQKCEQIKDTVWEHKCGLFCIDCVKKIEIDISPKTLCKLYGELPGKYINIPKWYTYCENCMQGTVEDVQKKEYSKLSVQ